MKTSSRLAVSGRFLMQSDRKTNELQRIVKMRILPAAPVKIEADEDERVALAKRFGIVSVGALDAAIELEASRKGVRVHGTMRARIIQTCSVSGEDFPVTIEEPIALHFIEEGSADLAPSEDEAIDYELTAEDLDEIEYSGDSVDLGEAVAQTLAIAIDPYAEGPNADEARRKAGIVEEGQQGGALAAGLAALQKK